MSRNNKSKKIIGVLALFFAAMCLINCTKIANSTQEKTKNTEIQAGSVDENSNGGNSNKSSVSKNSANINPNSSDSANPNIGIIGVSISPNEKDNKKFEITVDSISGWMKAKAGDEFDIMNEYGFLAKGKLISQKDGLWNAEIIPGSQRSDLLKLSNTRMMEREKESPNIPAFGVFPANPSRSKINIGDKVDMSEKALEYRKSVYQSLPKEAQEFGKTDENGAKGSLEHPNYWSDFDGDGKIDFVVIRGECEGNNKVICAKQYLLNNNKWLEIPENN